MERSPTVVTDLDGTLLVDGEVNGAVAEVVQALYDSGWELVILTDRHIDWVDETEDWLRTNGFSPAGVLFHCEGIRPLSVEQKRDWFLGDIAPEYNIRLVLDDDPAVIAMFRGLGVPAFQVADGAVPVV